MNEMIREEDLAVVARDLTFEQRQQVMIITAALERDILEALAPTYAAAAELEIDPLVVATAISLNALMLAAHLHAGDMASFMAMARQALALNRTGEEVQ